MDGCARVNVIASAAHESTRECGGEPIHAISQLLCVVWMHSSNYSVMYRRFLT